MSAAVLFQNMPPLSSEEYSALEQSIKDYGVQVPILVDENGTVIDGHHRQKITQELGVRCPSTVVTGKTESEKRTLALSLNLDRRHLNREQRRALVAESVKADPQLTDREHARRTGSSHPTVATVRRELEDNGRVESFTTRVDPRGYQQPASRPQFVDTTTGEIREDISDAAAPRPAPAARRRPSLVDDARSANADLWKAVERIRSIMRDDRFTKNKADVRDALHPSADLAKEILSDLFTT